MNIDKIKSVQYSAPAMTGADSTMIRVTQQDDSWWDIPMVSDNTDYQAVLEWVADGNTIADAD
jgi:hypothetical protein|tara:strand:+ start:386 stop:574 length:189 start_codon:yes stop_codon:yes gene_type:complete